MMSNDDISFITLTTYGTLHITCNLLYSALISEPDIAFTLYIIRAATNTSFYARWLKVCSTTVLPAQQYFLKLASTSGNREEFGTRNFFQIQRAKFIAARRELRRVSFIIYLDNDVVIRRAGVIDDLTDRLRTQSGVLFQQGRESGDKACAGVWALASTNRSLLSMWEKVSERKANEQQVLNAMWRRNLVSLTLLPPDLYMSGLYRQCAVTQSNRSTCLKIRSDLEQCCGSAIGRIPYLIHYNFLVGNEKERAMQTDHMWFVGK